MKLIPFLLSRVFKTYRTGFYCMPMSEGLSVTGTITIPNIGGFSYEISTEQGEVIERGAAVDGTVTISYSGSCYVTLKAVKNFADYNATVSITGLAYILSGTGTAGETVLSGNGKELNIFSSKVVSGSDLRMMLPECNGGQLIVSSSQVIANGAVNGWTVIVAY